VGKKLLVLDRNRNVRVLLQREFLREGYEVVLVRNCAELKEHLKTDSSYDLLILDPDYFETNPAQMLSWIGTIGIPVVFHSCLPESWIEESLNAGLARDCRTVVVVEKENVEELKRVVKKIISLSEREKSVVQQKAEKGEAQ